MASFSSIGIGLGGNVDVNALIKSSVDAVKLPITKTGGLQQQAAVTNAKVSAFGKFKSLVSALGDAAGKLGSVTGWNGVKASSSNTDAVSASAVGGAAATSEVGVNVGSGVRVGNGVACAPIPPQPASKTDIAPANTRAGHSLFELRFFMFVILSIFRR